MYLLRYNVKLFYTSYQLFHTFLSTCSQEANIKKLTPFSKYLHARHRNRCFPDIISFILHTHSKNQQCNTGTEVLKMEELKLSIKVTRLYGIQEGIVPVNFTLKL